LSDSLTITSVAYPDLFTAGGSFELFVVAEDGICEAVESDSRLNFDVNVPFKVAVESSGQTYCIDPENPEQVTLKAIVTPANAANHIDNYVWERLSLPVLKETTTSNTFILTDKWLSPGVNNEFRLSVTDGICATDTIKSSTNISLNYKSDSRVDFGLSYRVPNRDTICSEKDLVILSYNVSNSDDESGTVSYDLKLYYDRKGEFGYEQLSNNIVQTSGLHLDEYLPGDSLRFKIVVDDNICSTITKEVGTVVLTPFTASINVSKDPICENENVKFELANFKPEQSANYVKYYSWYQSFAETDGNFVPLSDFDNRAYETNQLKAGNYKVLSFISDGICYGVQMFGDPQGSVYSYETPQVELKVNAPIKVELIPSADAYCEGETPNPITFAAKVTQGEPSKYVWYNSENKVVKEILSTSTEDYFTIEPTVSDNAFKVEVYDGVCNTIGSAAENSFSVAVYQPFVLDVASSAYDICLGDSVNLGLGVLQGTARNITWSGDKVIPNKDNNIYSFAYPQLPGEAFYSVTASNGVCEDETVHVGPIIVHEPITVELTSNVSNVTIGAKIDLTANVLSGKPLEFEWMDGDVSIGKTNDVILEKYMPRSTSVFSLYATDGVCPVAFAQLELGVVLPTAFTPHTKDGLNDVYMEGYEVIIFDRYGQKVFEGANGWNGTHKGVMADPGVYFSQVKLLNGKIVSGTIEIVKYD
jgi:peptidoglycan hydrolase-like protein with peptidoglycan-binding domain